MEFTGAIHPVAALFPMLPDDELEELSADIKANGLIHPVVLDDDGYLIDGRNRLAACKIAGVAPKFTRLNGHDPVAYILSSNINRRHMTKGQMAMVAVEAHRVSGNRTTVRELEQLSGAKRDRIQRAVDVAAYAPDFVPGVVAGAESLDKAYDEARRRKEAAASTDTHMTRLQSEAPDLATLVTEERMTLREALAALTERERQRKLDITIVSDRLSKAVKECLDPLRDANHRARTIALFSDAESYLDGPLTRDLLTMASKNLAQLAKEWPR